MHNPSVETITSLSLSLYLPAFLAHVAQATTLGVLTTYIIHELHQRTSAVALIMVAGSFGVLSGNLPAAGLSKSYGCKFTVLVSAGVGLFGAVMCMVTVTPWLQNYSTCQVCMVATGMLFIGVSTSLGVVARTEELAKVPVQGRGSLSAWLSGMGRAGMAMGPIVGGILGKEHLFSTFLLQVCLYGLYALASLFFMKRSTPADLCGVQPSFWSQIWSIFVMQKSTLLRVSFAIVSLGMLRESRKFIIPLLGDERGYSVDVIGLSLSISYTMDALVIPLAGILLDTFGRFETITLSLFTMCLGLCILSSNTSLIAYLAGAGVMGLGNGFSSGAVIALACDHAPADNRGIFIGIFRIFATIADMSVPLTFWIVSNFTATSYVAVWCVLFMALAIYLSGAAYSFLIPAKEPLAKESEQPFYGAVTPHQAGTSAQSKIPSTPTIDFVIPLKSTGAITRTVLESVYKHYAPRAIYIICPSEEISVLKALSNKWNIPEGLLRYVEEESFFVKEFGMRQKEFEEFFDASRDMSKMREFGWWWQQLLKLGAARSIPELSDTFYVWDGDLIVLDAWPLVTHSPEGQAYHVAILQEKARSEFNKTEYEASVRTLLGMDTNYPEGEGTHVSHHMPINKIVVGEMIALIDSRLPGSEPWPAKILRTSSLHYRMSEYMLYATFILEQQKTCKFKHFRTHQYFTYGNRAIRIRNSKAFTDELVMHHGVEWRGYSYEQITSLLEIHQMKDSEFEAYDLEVGVKPSCLQVEHVYDLQSGNPLLDEAALTGDANVQCHRK